jgi:hypothetical protein
MNDDLVLWFDLEPDGNEDGSAYLPQMPELIARSRQALALMDDPEDATDAADRARKLASLAVLAKWPTEIINEATLLRAEALVRVADLVEEGQARGEIATRQAGRPGKESGARTLTDIGITRQRVSEGRKIRDSGALELARERLRRAPDRPVSFASLLAAHRVHPLFYDIVFPSDSIVPLTLQQANALVAEWHRHHHPLRVHRFSIGLTDAEGELVGAAICQKPASATTDQYLTLEVARLVVNPDIPPRDDGHANNACSRLYGACARIAKEMGFTQIQTFILDTEPGTSLKASGWKLDGLTEWSAWDHRFDGRLRRDELARDKQRWIKVLRAT